MLTWIDLLVLVVGGWGAFKGARTGAVRQVVGVVGLFVALAFAAALKDTAGAMLAGSFHLSPRVAPLAGFGVVLVSTCGSIALAPKLGVRTGTGVGVRPLAYLRREAR